MNEQVEVASHAGARSAEKDLAPRDIDAPKANAATSVSAATRKRAAEAETVAVVRRQLGGWRQKIDEVVREKKEELYLQSLLLGGEVMKYVSDAVLVNKEARVRVLYLWRNDIGDEGTCTLAEGLKFNQTLKSCNLNRNNIGDEGARALAEALKVNDTLEILHLFNNGIGDEGARCFAASLQANETLTGLFLGLNEIGDSGADSLLAAVRVNTSLTEVDVDNEHVSDEAKQAVVDALADEPARRTARLVFLLEAARMIKSAVKR